MKNYFLASFILLFFAMSCNQDEIVLENPSQELRFSKDTLIMDTIYNQVRSETYAVKVYNQEDKDVKIPRISLQGGNTSPYIINVDGQSGVDFRDVPLRKKDSLYIFVEIAPVATSQEAIVEDKIVFSTAKGEQSITLFSVVQDAEFFIKSSTNPNILKDNTTWTSDKAKIIFGDLTLAEGKTLDIKEGTKVYFTKNSSLKIAKNAKLNVQGSLGKEVLFRGDRNDPRYDTIPLNWKGIEIDENAVLNMEYAKIFGGETGLKLNNVSANIKNTIIHTFKEYGIYAVSSTIDAENLVMNNCGQADLGIFKGGNINLTHCTLVNYWRMDGILPAYSIHASNQWKNAEGKIQNNNLTLNITNSIIYGERENAVFFEPASGYQFNYLISHSLLKYGTKAGFDFDGNTLLVSSIKNEDPKFVFKDIAKMNLRLKEDSPARKKALNKRGKDIVGISRSAHPNMGAYE